MMHSSVVSSQILLALLIGHHKASFAFVRLGYIYRNVGCETVSVELIDLGISVWFRMLTRIRQEGKLKT